jgi:hypothetical protein
MAGSFAVRQSKTILARSCEADAGHHLPSSARIASQTQAPVKNSQAGHINGPAPQKKIQKSRQFSLVHGLGTLKRRRTKPNPDAANKIPVQIKTAASIAQVHVPNCLPQIVFRLPSPERGALTLGKPSGKTATKRQR